MGEKEGQQSGSGNWWGASFGGQEGAVLGERASQERAEGLAEELRQARPEEQGLVQGQDPGEGGRSKGCELNSQDRTSLGGDHLVVGGGTHQTLQHPGSQTYTQDAVLRSAPCPSPDPGPSCCPEEADLVLCAGSPADVLGLELVSPWQNELPDRRELQSWCSSSTLRYTRDPLHTHEQLMEIQLKLTGTHGHSLGFTHVDPGL